MSKAHPARRRAAAALLACLALATACSSGDDEAGAADDDAEAAEGDEAASDEPAGAALPAAYGGYESELYADDASWLCRPGAADDACAGDLDATAVAADGTTEVVRHEVAEDPPADCFYVYPTVSGDPTPNSDLEPGEEPGVAFVQAARLTSTCRVFAPLSFRSTAPPPADSFFGRPRGGDGVAGCVNPASPGGGPATLHPYFMGEAAFADPARNGEVTTPFVTFPDFIQAECVEEGGFSYLSITVDGDPADPRADDIGGDLSPPWGLHLIDVHVAMGDLVEMARSQIAAYTG
jgi:hypothetical protein